MPDDGYIRDLINGLRADIRDDFAELRESLKTKADKALTDERISNTGKRLDALEAARANQEAQKRSDRRWVVAAILVPVTIALIQLLASLRGAA